MANYALVVNGVVENIVIWDGDTNTWSPPDGSQAILIPDGEVVGIGYTYDGSVFSAPAPQNPPDAPPLDDVKKSLVADIDNTVASVYSTWTRFQAEYQAREAAAQSFKDGGYQGDPGAWVSAYATAAGLSNQQATDNILAQANALNGALATIGAQRMRKYSILSAADAATAQSVHDDIVSKIKAAVAALQ